MADNNFKDYTVQGPDGHTYTVTASPDATDEELIGFVQQNLSKQPAEPTQAPAPTPQVTVGPGQTPTPAPAPNPNEDNRQNVTVQGIGHHDDFKFGSDVQAEINSAMANPNMSPADVNALVMQRQKEAGQPALGLTPGYETQIPLYRQSLTKGNSQQNVGYSEVQLPTLNNPTVSAKQAGAPGLGGGMQGQIINWLTRSFQEAANNPDTFGGLAARLYGRAAYGDEAKKLLLQKYPQLTDDQAAELANTWIGQIQERAAQANSQEVANDPLLARFVGGMAGSAGPEYAVAPELGAGAIGRVAGTGAVTAASNLGYQAAAVAQDAQDHIDPAAVAEAGAFGAAFHGAMEAGSHLVSSFRPRVDDSGTPVATDGISVPTSKRNTKAYTEQLTNTRQDIADHINGVVSGWKNAPEFEVHENFKNIDGAENDALGAYGPDGKIYVNAEKVLANAKKAKVDPETVVNAMVYHEALGHHGLAQKFGDDLSETMQKFYDNGTKAFRDSVDNWVEKNGDVYKDRPDAQSLAVEEVLAEMSEKGRLPVTVKDRVSNFVKDFGRKMGLDLKYSTREVRTILAMAHDATINGKPGDVAGNGFKFMNVGEKALLDREDIANRIKSQIADANESLTPDEIYKKYGWWKDQDGKWRTRLSDSESALYAEHPDSPQSYLMEDLPKAKPGQYGHLDEFLHHPALYDAYPFLRKLRVYGEDREGYLGGYHPRDKTISINTRLLKETGEDPHSVLLHEVQHAIQDHEGFAGGGNTETALERTLKSHEVKPAAEKLLETKKEELDRIEHTIDNIVHVLHGPVKPDKELATNLSKRWTELLSDLAYKEHAIDNLSEAINSGDLAHMREWVVASDHIKEEAYKLLLGEVEARETEQVRHASQNQLRQLPKGVGAIEKWHPDYLRIRDNPSGISGAKYMREYKPDEEAAIESAKEILDGSLDNYQPRYSSWAEGKRAARDRGLTSKQIRSAKSVGELDKKIFQYDEALYKTNNQLATLLEKRDRGEWTPADKAKFLEVSYTFNEATAKVFNDHAEIARALNALKAIYFSRNKLSQLREILSQAHDSSISAFADEDTFDKFADQMKFLLQSNNPEGTGIALRSITKPYWWEYALSFRHSMMLSGLGTHAKNATDNALMIARELEESILATPGFFVRKGINALGGNVQEGVSPHEVAGRLYGILRATLDWGTYKDAIEAFMRGHPNRAINPKIELADARIPIASKVGDALYAADTLFRAIHMNANLYSLGVRRAREEGFKGLAAFEEGSNYAALPSERMLKEARGLTDLALLLDTPSGLAAKLESVKSIRPNMKAGEQFTAFTANLLFPFFRVTDRLLFQKLRRSPVAFLDKNTRADIAAGGARMDIAISRMLMGSALIYYYWNVAGQQKETGNAPTDPKKYIALQAGGYQKNSVLKDGKYVDASALNLSFLPGDTQNSVATNIASLREAWDKAQRNGASQTEKQKIADGIGMSILALGNILSSNSFANNLQTYTEPFTQNDDATAKTAGANLTSNLLGQWLPAAMRQYNQAYGDTTRRDTTGDKSFADRVTGSLMANIPGQSEKLPAKYDLYGDAMQQGRSLSGMSNYQTVKTDAVSKELQRLESTTDKPVVTSAPSSFDLTGVQPGVFNPKYVVSTDDDKVKLTAAGHEEWQRIQGYYLKAGMSKLIRMDAWKSATDKQRIAIVKQLKSDASSAAKEHMVTLMGLQARQGYGEDDNGE